jgi:hypothetical protein
MGLLHTNTLTSTTTYVVDSGPIMLMGLLAQVGGGDDGVLELFNGSVVGDAVAANLVFTGSLGGPAGTSITQTFDGVLLPSGCVVKITLSAAGPAHINIEIE